MLHTSSTMSPLGNIVITISVSSEISLKLSLLKTFGIDFSQILYLYQTNNLIISFKKVIVILAPCYQANKTNFCHSNSPFNKNSDRGAV